MRNRPVSSPFRRLTGTVLSLLAFSLVSAAQAEESRSPPLLSLLFSSLQKEEAPAPATNNGYSSTATLTSASINLSPQEVSAPPLALRTIDLTLQTDNLWDRIRNGFAMTNLNDDLVLYYQQYYQSRPEALRRMVERSRPFLHHIVEELEARGMPTELALLPMVESAFNPMAYSKAHAAGLWQFIPATGKRFNLQQNWWQDQRRDIVASTSAALDYLQAIYEMHGDWHLALASYNWGEGAVKRAIEKNESRGLPTDYPNLTMPNETRHYVPKLQALKNILGSPELVAQLGIPAIPNRPYLAMLEAPRPMDVKTAARLANLSLEEFQRLNPSHNRPIIKPDSAVVIPADKLDTFYSNLQNHQAPLSEWRGYTVQSSERIERIASQFGISAGELARVNGLPERARLGAGSTLLVPGGGNRENLGPLLNAMAPTHIIEAEPKACKKKGKRSVCGKSESAQVASYDNAPARGGKSAKGQESAKLADKNGAKSSSKQASLKGESSKPGKQAIASSKTTGKPATSSAKASSKPANAPTRVAKSGNGRRS